MPNLFPRYANGSFTEPPRHRCRGVVATDTRVFRDGVRVDGDPTPYRATVGDTAVVASRLWRAVRLAARLREGRVW